MEDDEKLREDQKYSELWEGCYGEQDEEMVTEVSGEYVDVDGGSSDLFENKYGQFKLQRKTGGVGGLDDTDRYRIIYCRDLKENKWQIMDHSDDESEMMRKYNDFIEMLKWKNKLDPGIHTET